MSRKAYRLGGQNLQLPFLCGVFKAYLDQGLDIADVHVLAQIAETAKIMTKEQVCWFSVSSSHRTYHLSPGRRLPSVR